MSFVYPSFLFALAVIAIPILIHLFNFRRYKKVFFPNVRFLKEIKEETINRSRLKHILILISRILAFSFLVFAFAQPYVPLSEQNKGRHNVNRAVSIFLDNSFSMSSVGEQGPLLEVGKQYSYEILNGFNESDRFQFVLNNKNSSGVRFLHKAAAEQKIGKSEISYNPSSLSQRIKQQSRALLERKEENKELFIISDFQDAEDNLLAEDFDSNIRYHFIPLFSTNANNVFIDSVWFSNPVRKVLQADEIFFRIVNHSDKNLDDFPIKLELNGSPKSTSNIDVSAGSSKISSFSFTISNVGIQTGAISIEDYPITHDNIMYFSYSIKNKTEVLILNEKDSSKAFSALYGAENRINLTQAASKNAVSDNIEAADVVILNGLKSIPTGLANDIHTAVLSGKQLVVFPGADADIDGYNKLLGALNSDLLLKTDSIDIRAKTIDYDSELYAEAFTKTSAQQDMPMCFTHYKTKMGISPSRKNLLELANGEVLLSQIQPDSGNSFSGAGNVFLWSVPLDETWSNLSKHALFVISMYQIATLNSRSKELYLTISGNVITRLRTKTKHDDVLKVRKDNYEFIPELRHNGNKSTLWMYENLIESGQYELQSNQKTIAGISANYSRQDSRLDPISLSKLEAFKENNELKNLLIHTTSYENLTKSLKELNEGKKYWELMLMLTLLMLLIEILLIKFWKE